MEDKEKLVTYLASQVKGYGLGENHEKAIREGIASGNDFELFAQRKKLGEVSNARLYFRNSEAGTFFNSFKVSLLKPGSSYERKRMFFIDNKPKAPGEFSSFHISFREAHNLLAGRSIPKEVIRNEQKDQVYLTLDFKKTDKHGNPDLTVQYPEYGFKLSDVASRFNFAGPLADRESNEWQAFAKGDLVEGRIMGADGKEREILASYNAMYKNITLYDSAQVMIKREELVEKQYVKINQNMTESNSKQEVKKNELSDDNKTQRQRKNLKV